MIVELFGPPGGGKTTFASALTAFLRERGQAVDPLMSYRPAEQAYAPAGTAHTRHQPAAPLQRLARPVVEMLATAGHLLSHSNDFRATAELMQLLPTRDLMWAIRLRQYLWRLFRIWDTAVRSSGVVVFDQAFVQAVGSLALLARAPEGACIGRALDAIPRADLLIQIDAPRDALAARLTRRQQHQGRVERLLELDLQTNLAFGETIGDLQARLCARGRPVLRLECADQPTLRAGVETAGAAVLARRPAQPALGPQAARRPEHA